MKGVFTPYHAHDHVLQTELIVYVDNSNLKCLTSNKTFEWNTCAVELKHPRGNRNHSNYSILVKAGLSWEENNIKIRKEHCVQQKLTFLSF